LARLSRARRFRALASSASWALGTILLIRFGRK
jgi:hypothetical protein